MFSSTTGEAPGISSILRAAGVESATFHANEAQNSSRTGPAGEGGGILVSYCTDIEGNYDYWQRFLSLSKVIVRVDKDGAPMHIPHDWTGRAHSSAMSIVSNSTLNSINITKAYGGRYPDPVYPAYTRLSLKPNCHFVFGGDVCDRGPGDVRVLWDLLQLHEDHPGRVHFILGNRDVNKLRIPTELHDCYLRKAGATYWNPNDPEQRPQISSQRMKWILQSTMGSPEGFEHRRTELKQIIVQQQRDRAAQRQFNSRDAKFAVKKMTDDNDSGDEDDPLKWDVNNRYATEQVTVSDEDVVQSYFDLLLPSSMGKAQGGRPRAQVSPQSLHLKYLMYATLVTRIEDNLFVHGGINENNLGWVPPQSTHKRFEDDISATGAVVVNGAGAQGGGVIAILTAAATAESKTKSSAKASTASDATALDSEETASAVASTRGRISKRAAFDAWCSEMNWRARAEVRDFAENTRAFLRQLNMRHPNGPSNNRNTFGRNSFDANYTATATEANTPAHWAITGTYSHPQPGSRLAFQGMAVCPDKSRNPSIIYSGYTANGMPVNIDRYEGTIVDESGRVIADAAAGGGELLKSMFLAKAGSFLSQRRGASQTSIALSKTEEKNTGSSSDEGSDAETDSKIDARTAEEEALLKSSLHMTPKLAGVFVRELGINRIFCGHQPHGDAPLTINVTIPVEESKEGSAGSSSSDAHTHAHTRRRLQIILADTSYSANAQWNLNSTLKPKTGSAVIWSDDWKALSLDRLKADNEEREKSSGGDDASLFSADIPDVAEDKKDAKSTSSLAASAKGEAKTAADRAQAPSAKADSKDNVSSFGAADKSVDERSMTPQMRQDEEDNAAYNCRPLKLWNLDAIQSSLNTRGIAVSEVLVYVPLFTGVVRNESVAEANVRRQRATATPSRVFMHGTLSDGSTYAFEQPANEFVPGSREVGGDGSRPPVDRYIGKSTRSGKWVVKAANVHAKRNLSNQYTRHLPSTAGDDRTKGQARASAAGVSSIGENVYLLCRGEGFLFRNKLVAASDMEEEMNA